MLQECFRVFLTQVLQAFPYWIQARMNTRLIQIVVNFNQEKYICLVFGHKLTNNTSKAAGYIKKLLKIWVKLVRFALNLTKF
jgi:hypothetical protein